MATKPKTTKTTPDERAPLLRDPSLWSYEQVMEMGLRFFTDKEGFKALPEKEQHRDICAFIWVHHVEIDEDHIEAAVADGTWRDEVRRFHRDPRSIAALPDVEPMLAKMVAMMRR